MLEVENLSYVRGDKPLFHRLRFKLEPGQTLYVLGVNGSGKSTLLKLLGNLLTCVTDCITWRGQSVRALAGLYRQEYLWLGERHNGMKPELSVEENVHYWHQLMGHRSPKSSDRVWREMGLLAHRDRLYGQLSGGEKQRVGLLPLLTIKRRLWLLDEPTSGLDAQGIVLIDQLIRDHAARGGITVCATHHWSHHPQPATRYLQLACHLT